MKPRLWWIALLLLAGCERESGRYTGYVEGEYVRISAPVAGRLVALAVARGTTAKAGDALFTLEAEREQAFVSEASGSIAVVRAQIDQAAAQLKLAEANFKRLSELRRRQGLASQEEVEQALTTQQAARARLRELEAQRRAAEAQLSQVQWQLTQKTVAAPVAGLVDDTIFRVGEWVPAGSPVVSLLPPENRLVRFFVPETVVGTLRVGQGVTLYCDGCAAPTGAAISFISPDAEFTPPVIYSRETRHKLVFLVEARPNDVAGGALHPGQPVEVELGS
jgi:HlyD family secretion protein